MLISFSHQTSINDIPEQVEMLLYKKRGPLFKKKVNFEKRNKLWAPPGSGLKGWGFRVGSRGDHPKVQIGLSSVW